MNLTKGVRVLVTGQLTINIREKILYRSTLRYKYLTEMVIEKIKTLNKHSSLEKLMYLFHLATYSFRIIPCIRRLMDLLDKVVNSQAKTVCSTF